MWAKYPVRLTRAFCMCLFALVLIRVLFGSTGVQGVSFLFER